MRIVSVALAGLAVAFAVSSATPALAAKKPSLKGLTAIKGCVYRAAPCYKIESGGTVYALTQPPKPIPPVPLNTGVTIWGKAASVPSICFGQEFQVVWWQKNPKIVCVAK